MKKRFAVAFAAIGIGVCVMAWAGIEPAEAGLVTRLRSYNSFGNGDVIFWVQTAPAGCDGLWFRTTELNGKEMFAQLLSAQKTLSSVYITANNEQIWPGSASLFCKVYSLDTYSN